MNRAFFLLACATHAALAGPVTFNKEIAPIVFRYCSPCHRPGEAGPFSLLRYQDAKQRAQQIAAVTHSRYMPPWLPDEGTIRFSDELRLSDEQIGLIARWVAGGAIEGRAADLPQAPHFSEGWQLGEPDLVLTAPRAFTLPASGPDIYRNFIFAFPLEGSRYVRALEIRPGNKRVVHHANVLIDRTRSERWQDGRDGQPGFPGMDLEIAANLNDPESHFLFWKPGTVLAPEPAGMAWPIEQGSDLVLNVHLQPSGKAESVQPSLGLYFAKDPPKFRPLLVQLENDRALDIPPGRADFVVTDEFTLPVDVDLLGVYPHAHYLGEDFEGDAKLPDGSRKQLIRIRHWDLNWQAVYRYEKPLFLPKGTTVSMRWSYDNSAGNVANPNHPPKRVVAGDQSTDEMAHFWLQLLPRGPGDQRMVIQEALMRKRLGRDPDNFTAHFNLGGVLDAKGDRSGAVEELRQALRLRPRDAVALNTLAALLQMEGKLDEAETSYRSAIEARPLYADAHYNLANVLLSRGKEDEALGHLREVVRLEPDDAKARGALVEALETRAGELGRSGRLKEAAADFRELVALKPSDSDACTNLGVALAMQGALDEAKGYFERALELNPTNEVARKNLDRVRKLMRQGR